MVKFPMYHKNKPIESWIDTAWFYYLELSCIFLAAVLWSKFPGFNWQPLLIAIAPLVIRITAGQYPIKSTPLDIPIFLFLLTAGVGIWAAYRPENAWIKFWLILASILFYYLIARQNVNHLYHTAGLLSLLGLGVGVFFFLSNNWEEQQVKFQLISRIGEFWMQIRPDFNLIALHPNDVAGIASIAVPFSLALTLEYCKRKSAVRIILFGFISVVILATILLSSSRGAWMAISMTAGLLILWEVTKRLSKIIKLTPRILYPVLLVIFGFLLVGTLWISLHGRTNQIVIGNSNGSVSENRFHVFWSTLELIKDVPFTGSGLDSFSGLYSNYILIIPNYFLGYAHNIFLDISLQQGILGGLVFFWIYFGSILLLLLHPPQSMNSILHKAVLSSLLIIIFHGLVDVIVYRTIFTALLFFVPGMAVGLSLRYRSEIPSKIQKDKKQLRQVTLPAFTVIGVILLGTFAFTKPVQAAWYTNLGSIEMAKVELADFPTGTWDEGHKTDLLSHAESLLQKALEFDPANPGANYRLGLIAMLKRDYLVAINRQEIAYRGNPNHRGIIKALGYSYLWQGQIDAAQRLLTQLPETEHEVGNYISWWRVNRRPDLAFDAEKYLERSKPE